MVKRFVVFVLALCGVLISSVSFAQLGEHRLPANAVITGIDFHNRNHGIITTADSLVYLVNVQNQDSVRFTPVNVLNMAYPDFASLIENPVWLNDSTVFITTYEGVGGDKYLKMSQDTGRTWQEVAYFSGLDYPGEYYAVGDSLLFFTITSDVVGSMGLYILDIYGEQGDWRDFHDIYSGGFTPINSDTVVFTTFTDSLAFYSISNDSLWFVETDLKSPRNRSPLFRLLEYAGDDILIGSTWWRDSPDEPDSLFRSTDGGKTWSFVLEGRRFTSFSQTRYTWIADIGSTLQVYQSRNQGGWWTELTSISGGKAFAPSSPVYYWIGADSGRVYQMWYGPNRVENLKNNSLPRSIEINAYPNPFNSSVTFRLQNLDPNTDYDVRVYNLLGQRIRTIFTGNPDNDALSLRWDGKAADGTAVGSGIYFIRVRTEGFRIHQKISLVR
ncbi:MAG: T9SS type A sorting domain-containing protein [Candidatus Marinimicrobia bacterium]|nr:T9SS type A sorting domain-containing protein [Candidatus Neomarinimicrobiota bacterium]MCF7828530.1 T9SS type A sorting domain-containing protein [Candidatus Neomarinimicrobiota bacterium]MCF7882047.1 T9SS type A sorting domain-containing protein [Candidatus Neomarinimicrobiota bacterium]